MRRAYRRDGRDHGGRHGRPIAKTAREDWNRQFSNGRHATSGSKIGSTTDRCGFVARDESIKKRIDTIFSAKTHSPISTASSNRSTTTVANHLLPGLVQKSLSRNPQRYRSGYRRQCSQHMMAFQNLSVSFWNYLGDRFGLAGASNVPSRAYQMAKAPSYAVALRITGTGRNRPVALIVVTLHGATPTTGPAPPRAPSCRQGRHRVAYTRTSHAKQQRSKLRLMPSWHRTGEHKRCDPTGGRNPVN